MSVFIFIFRVYFGLKTHDVSIKTDMFFSDENATMQKNSLLQSTAEILENSLLLEKIAETCLLRLVVYILLKTKEFTN